MPWICAVKLAEQKKMVEKYVFTSADFLDLCEDRLCIPLLFFGAFLTILDYISGNIFNTM